VVSKRRFQAGVKLWMACSAALAAGVGIAVAMPWLSPSVTMFGFMALVFTMRERVESSAEMVSGDIIITVHTVMSAQQGCSSSSSLLEAAEAACRSALQGDRLNTACRKPLEAATVGEKVAKQQKCLAVR
jgi:hypothetical protein